MRNFLDNIFSRSNNLEDISNKLKHLSSKTPAGKIFKAINTFSSISEIRYVGGCVRKAIINEKIDDIDLATNLEPTEVCEALKKYQIDFYKTGVEHGTITALIDNYKFEITSLREDVSTDGRHAQVKFTKDWKKDASRRDFTINSIYSDCEGNLFDPYNGKDDLLKGKINFIGNPEIRIREDYLRILRYIRFFLNYSKEKHNPEIIKFLKMNLDGVSKLSKERLIDELRKILDLKILKRLTNDKISLEFLRIIFPQLKNFKVFSKLNSFSLSILERADFIFLISLLIIDKTDDTDFFLYKFNISKKHQKRLKIIHEFFKEKLTTKTFTENNLNRIFYFKGKQAVIDILNYRLLISNKPDDKLLELSKTFQTKEIPAMPIKADYLMTKYKISQGKNLGDKLKKIEEEWVKNNFQISESQVENILFN